MSFLNIIENRYTTKTYDSSKKISEEDINELKEILRLSPSSINSQPWKFTFVDNENIKRDLAEVSYHNKDRIVEASHLVVFSVIDSIELFEKQIEENIPKRAVDYYNQFLKSKADEEIKSWFSNQVYLSLGIFLSACATMKIDSTPMEGIVGHEYDKILGLNNYKALFSVAIGIRNIKDPNQLFKSPKSRLDKEKIICSL